ncbi:MAG: IS21 family transposase [Gammaproteobacteria bacterium]|nr:IS21 family transposase [Gammaproteobacteria bacterium]
MPKVQEGTMVSNKTVHKVPQNMKTRAEVQQMSQLQEQGHTPYRIAQVLGCSRNTVVRYLRLQRWQPWLRRRCLAGLEDWLEECFLHHDGNAAVLVQELRRQHGLEVSLRTVERAVRPLRQRLRAARVACVRYETALDAQLQIDFGSKQVVIGEQRSRVFVFVATFSFSRRQFVAAYSDESQRSWFDGLERAFRHFDGVPRTVLMDNARALVSQPRRGNRPPVFHERLVAFAKYWGFEPRACKPHRAQTKGKDERSVGYVKSNAFAGHTFASWGALDRHLESWLQTVADRRIHGSTGVSPLERFALEQPMLTPVAGRPSFGAPTELVRRVSRDCAIVLVTNQYSVPWQLVGEQVRVTVTEELIRIFHQAQSVATHPRCRGRHQRQVDAAHFQGLGILDRPVQVVPTEESCIRSLAAYQQVVEELGR